MSFDNETLLSLFNCYIGGIVNYASEIWGIHKKNNVEKLHLEFCKQFLGVKRCTSNMAVYAELGRVPLTCTRLYSLIKYWSKVVVSDNCIIRQCYDETYNNCENFWHVKILEIWHIQEIDRTLLAILKQKINDQAKQEIYANIENSRIPKKYS